MFNLKLKENRNRLKFDIEVGEFQSNINKNKKLIPSISAVYRVKNAESCLELSILSIASICSEIIIIDNNSSDKTLVIAKKIQQNLSSVCEVKIYAYKNNLSIAGDDYKIGLTTESSLANYYTYCFSKATCDYVMKCDAHLIYTPQSLVKIQKKLKEKRRVIIFRGVELYGMKLSYERYIFKNDNSFKYIDGDCYEELVFDYKLSKIEQIRSTILTPCFIHVKRSCYINYIGSDCLVNKLYS
ncbi:glycosyltransferase [Photobacterium phosphoreum]|uniref:glycosyltransferase n=1 Tax=Photobacterium phosphoreum TaxID=659 RepID=UPI0024B6D204|nr:glycosyltransferase [Photobacterium phosphoreum]